MLRFLPDSWLDALLRPLLLADPVASLYVEITAPDFRFLALAALLLLAWLSQRLGAFLSRSQLMTLISLTGCCYLWVVTSGNGRYFMWGLLLVGPLVVMAARRLRATLAMRNTVVIGVLALQVVAIAHSFGPNMWGLRPWKTGPGLALGPTPLRDSPAVFVTMGSISYSALVPQMHPDSRWSNIAGQRDILPGVREFPELQVLLDSPLPKYVAVRATALTMGPDLQPTELAWKSLVGSLGRSALALDSARCTYVPSADAIQARVQEGAKAIEEGFWFCPIRRDVRVQRTDPVASVAPEVDDVFRRVEQRCPRFFPPGSARSRQIDGAVLRYYSYSDTGLYVDNSGEVYFKNNRALNPTLIATIEKVRSDNFTLDCQRMPGRYLPPWERE